jgi:hypothetical protein
MTATLDAFAEDIRAIHQSDPAHAKQLIEAYLLEKLTDVEPSQQLELLARLRGRFAGASLSEPVKPLEDTCQFRDLLANVLGKHLDDTVSSTDAMINQLSASLNRIFDSVNEIVGVIHTTLLGEHDELQTIRRLIHSDLKESRSTGAIEQYLNQIKRAFLLSNRAFQMAARSELKKVLDELDPNRHSQEGEHGLKFGFLRKSDRIEEYHTRFDRIRKWFESDRFSEDLSREFERICQRLYAEKGEEGETERHR